MSKNLIIFPIAFNNVLEKEMVAMRMYSKKYIQAFFGEMAVAIESSSMPTICDISNYLSFTLALIPC